jgi:hypothetical protein
VPREPLQAPEDKQVVALTLFQVSVAEPPAATVLGLTCSVTAGAAAVTVTIADCDAVPPGPLQVNSNSVRSASFPVVQVPWVATAPFQPPPAVHAVAPAALQDSVDWPMLLTVVGDADRVTTGAWAVLVAGGLVAVVVAAAVPVAVVPVAVVPVAVVPVAVVPVAVVLVVGPEFSVTPTLLPPQPAKAANAAIAASPQADRSTRGFILERSQRCGSLPGINSGVAAMQRLRPTISIPRPPGRARARRFTQQVIKAGNTRSELQACQTVADRKRR